MRIERFNSDGVQIIEPLGFHVSPSDDSTDSINRPLKKRVNEMVGALEIFVLQNSEWIKYTPDTSKGFFTIGSGEEDSIMINNESEIQKQHIIARRVGKTWFIIERAEKSILLVNNVKRRQVTLKEQSSCILQFGSFTILMTTNTSGGGEKVNESGKTFKVTNSSDLEYRFNAGKTVLIGSNPLCDIVTKGWAFEGLISAMEGVHFFYSITNACFMTGQNNSKIPIALPEQSKITTSSGFITIEFPAGQQPSNYLYQVQTRSNPTYFILSEIVEQKTLGRKTILPPNGHSVSAGRGKDNYMVIDSSRVSRHHAQIITSSINIILTDCESTNGTFVNDARITRKIVLPGDIISFAGSEFILIYNEQ